MAFDQEKYKQIFEQRFGKGSYQRGLSKASEIGKAKGNITVEKEKAKMREQMYKDFLKAQEEAEKAAEKESQAIHKSVNADKDNQKKRKQVQKAKEQGRGGYLPSREQQMKEREIQSSGLTGKVKKQVESLPSIDKSVHEKKKTKSKATSSKKKKDDDDNFLEKAVKGVGDYIGGQFKQTAKNVKTNVQALNPFDDVSFKEANKKLEESNKKHAEKKNVKEATRQFNRFADSASLGTLSTIQKKELGKEPDYKSERKFGEGGGIDLTTDLLGMLAPGGGSYKAAKGLGKLMEGTKVGKKAASLPKVAKKGIEGGTAGLLFSGVQETNKEIYNPDKYSAGDHAKNIGLNVALGGGLDMAAHGLGKTINALRNKGPLNANSKQMDEFTKEAADEPLGLPEPKKARLTKLGKEVEIKGTPLLNPPVGQNQLASFIGGGKPDSYWQQRLKDFTNHVNSSYDQNNLTQEGLEDLWTQFARYDEDVTLEELIDLGTPTARNIEAYSQPKGNPLEFRKMVPSYEKNLSYVGRMDPKDMVAQRAVRGPVIDAEFKEIPPGGPLNANAKQQEEFLKEANDVPDGEPQQLRLFLQNFNNEAANSPLDGVKSKVNREIPKDNKLKEFINTARTQFVDDLSPLEKLEKNIRGTVSSAEDSLYKTGRLFRGSPERAHEVVRQKLSPIVQEAKAAGYSMEDLGDYALAKHAEDVNDKGINSGFSQEQISKTLMRLETPKMEELRQKLVQVSDDILKEELVDSGILSQEAYEAMRKKWPNYMPMFRSFDDEKVEFASGLSGALANAQNPIKRLEGSDRDVIDPIESMVKNIFQATTQADKNRVGKQLAKLAADDTEGNFIKKLAPNEETGRKNVISVFENGEKVKYEVPPEIYRSMKDLDKQTSNTIAKWLLQKPASTLRAGATLTPEFSLRNPMRDVVQAYVVSNSGFNPMVDFPIGLWNAIFKGKTFKVGGKEIKSAGELYKNFITDNGGYGNIVSMDRELHRTVLEKVLKEGDGPKFINVLKPNKWLDLLRTIADVSETATKLGEYRAALRSGASRQEAAYRARDIMDFGRAGNDIREINKYVAFLNANIQGKSKLIRAIQNDWKGTTSRAFTAVTLPTFGAFVAQKMLSNDEQKATIEDAPQWLKDTFWLVPVPGTNQVARIPKPFDLAPPFANTLERFLDYAWNGNEEAFDKFLRQSVSSYSVPMMLTGALPIIEGMSNYSWFRQGPIDPMRDQDVEYPDRYDINTSETAKVLGKGVNALTDGEGAFKNFGSPRIIDNSIRGFFGGLGEYSVDAIDALIINPIQKATGTDEGIEKPDKQINQQPLLRSFLVNQGSTGESVGKIYDLVDKLKKAKGSDSPSFDEVAYDQANDTAKQISDITKQMREIENNPDMSGEEKRKQLDVLNKQRNEIARSAAKQLK